MAKKQFKAESKRLLDLMINSIYTHKEIFLREIISNASDAIDKLCYVSLTDDSVGLGRSDFRIRVKVDEEEGTITVSDNGIGMSKEDMESNLGVIARSGSLKFKSELSDEDAEKADIDNSGDLDLKECLTLSIALTLNNLSLGVVASIAGINILLNTISAKFLW